LLAKGEPHSMLLLLHVATPSAGRKFCTIYSTRCCWEHSVHIIQQRNQKVRLGHLQPIVTSCGIVAQQGAGISELKPLQEGARVEYCSMHPHQRARLCASFYP
jgi:hypothetical protein